MVASASHSDYSELQISGIDTDNNGAVTSSLYINGNKTVGVYVTAVTGSHATHVLTVQVSADDSNWFDSSSTVTGIGFVEFDTIAQHVRAKVTTAEGSASTVDLFLTSK